MCPPPVLVWACLALFWSLQPHVLSTPLVFYLVTDLCPVTGTSSKVASPSRMSRHPLYRPFGTWIYIRPGALTLLPITKSPSRACFDFLLPLGICSLITDSVPSPVFDQHIYVSRHPVCALAGFSAPHQNEFDTPPERIKPASVS